MAQTYKSSPCNSHSGPDHPIKLDLEFTRKHIEHTIGEHPPNKQGYLLCNGHCDWEFGSCSGISFFCLNCGYAECWGCAEDFSYALEELHPKWDGQGITDYCRKCGDHTSLICISENHSKLEWLSKIIGVV